MRECLALVVIWFSCLTAQAVQPLSDKIDVTIEAQASCSNGLTPLWLNANRYGLSSLQSDNGYLRATAIGHLYSDTLRQLSLDAGLDIVGAYHYDRSFILQQGYVEGRFRHGALTIGQKQQPMALKNQRLSSGSQTLGINARPCPEVRLALPDYWDIPYTRHWLALKGHLAYGFFTDNRYQKDWTQGQQHYTQDVLLHTKAGYLRIGRDHGSRKFFLNVELGLEMAAQYGGTLYHTEFGTVQGNTGIKAMINAFTATGDDEVNEVHKNVGGNQLGSWVARFNFNWRPVSLSVYFDHYFEDHSSMFLLDYDGYGQGEEWMQRKQNRYILYPLKDFMLGGELEFHRFPWLKNVVLEYIDTRYQSGPIYHDHSVNISDHLGGNDGYYNHYLYQGWIHWGQVMGNPLYRSPIYNTDHTLLVQDTRFWALHLGMEGSFSALHGPLSTFGYRFLATYQIGLGTYQMPFLKHRGNYSTMTELSYRLPAYKGLDNVTLRMAFGFDYSGMLGDNTGFQFTVIYQFPHH